MPEFLRWLTSDDVYPWVMGMLGILVLVLFRVWALVRRLRGDGLVLVGDDPTDEADDLMAIADAVREDTCSTPDEEPTAQYVPCGLAWPTDDDSPCGDGHWHCCTRMPGGHQRHVCLCGAQSDQGPVLVVDPPTVRQYVDPDSGMTSEELWGPPPAAVKWVTFGTVRVHQDCMDARRDGRPDLITDGCRPHLIGAATDLPAGGAA